MGHICMGWWSVDLGQQMLNVLSSAAMKGFTCFEPSPFPRVDDIFQAWPAAAEEQSILPGKCAWAKSSMRFRDTTSEGKLHAIEKDIMSVWAGSP